MKYIKGYKIFEGDDNILSEINADIRDMLLDLVDSGFVLYHSSEFGYMGGKKIHYVTIKSMNKYSHLQGFKFNDVKEDVLRVKDYLGDKYRFIKVQPGYNGSYITLDLDKDGSLDRYTVYAVSIGFSL